MDARSPEGTGGWPGAWETALSALEIDVATAEEMIRLGHVSGARPTTTTWTPPSGLGPLPVTLHDRAAALLDRQLETALRLAEAADLSRRHSRAAQAMRSAPPAVPVYLDTPA